MFYIIFVLCTKYNFLPCILWKKMCEAGVNQFTPAPSPWHSLSFSPTASASSISSLSYLYTRTLTSHYRSLPPPHQHIYASPSVSTEPRNCFDKSNSLNERNDQSRKMSSHQGSNHSRVWKRHSYWYQTSHWIFSNRRIQDIQPKTLLGQLKYSQQSKPKDLKKNCCSRFRIVGTFLVT